MEESVEKAREHHKQRPIERRAGSERILIIDNKTETNSFLTGLLEPLGYQLATACNGQAGLQMALAEPPDLLLLDLNVQGVPGIKVLEGIRRHDFAYPGILMACPGSEETLVRALRLGVRDCILKPVDINELIVSIDWALAEGRLRCERERLVSELQVANDQLRQGMVDLVTLQAVGRFIAPVMPRDEVLHRILDAAFYLTDADASVVFLVEPEGGDLRLEAVRHSQGYVAGLAQPAVDRNAVEVLRACQPIRLSRARRPGGLMESLGTRAHSLLYVPIRSGEAVAGVLGVAAVRAEELPAEAEGQLIALADYAAIALHNSRLYEEAEQRAGQLAAVNRVAQTVASSLDLDTVIAAVLHEVRQSVRAESALLALREEEAQELALAVVLDGKGGEVSRLRLPIGHGVIGWVVEHGLPARIDDVARDAGCVDRIDHATGFRTRSLLCVPVTLPGRVLGAIEAVNKLDTGTSGSCHAFTHEDEKLLEGVAAFAALAIENARLHAAVRETVAAERLHEVVVTLSHHVNNPLQSLMGAAERLRCEAEDLAAQTPAGKSPAARIAELIEEKALEISIVLSILEDLSVLEHKSYLGTLQMINIEQELRQRIAADSRGGKPFC